MNRQQKRASARSASKRGSAEGMAAVAMAARVAALSPEGRAAAYDAQLEELACAAPALAAEVLRLRAERDVLRHERDEHAHKAGEWEESHDIELARAERVEAAARAHLAAADAFSTACRTAAADVPAACARADAARECLAGLVGYTGIGGGR